MGTALFSFTIPVVLGKERPEIVDLLLILDACERHFGTWDLCFRVLDVLLEYGFIPGDAGVPVSLGIAIVGRRASFAAINSIELRTDLVLGTFADRVAGQALVERGFAGRDVLRQDHACGCGPRGEDEQAQGKFFHRVCSL
jgi:hypothetical protein